MLLATLIGTDFLTGELLSRLFQNAAEGFFRPLEGQGRRAGRPRAADYRHGQTCQRHLSRMEAVLNPQARQRSDITSFFTIRGNLLAGPIVVYAEGK